jgi:DNA-binding MarR family transcriptional regulator
MGSTIKETPAPEAESDHYRLEESVGHLLRRAHQRHTNLFQSLDGSDGLTPTQFAVLVRLEEEKRSTQNRLGRLAALDTATIQGVVQRLIARGLVASERDPLDRRTVVLSLTEAGLAVLDSAAGRGRSANRLLLEPLAPADQETLIRLLRQVLG